MIYDIYEEVGRMVSKIILPTNTSGYKYKQYKPIMDFRNTLHADRKTLYLWRDGCNFTINTNALNDFTKMGYEIHLIPVDKVNQVKELIGEEQ